ncbi:MAG: alpha/beta hydrolase family protein [Mucilaginibacter sp.]|uniref:alpha/beta hydrolase family protein n=1 Tax=Mucilaginibacter sp. TaxID=1882438 RepID=UPI0034E5DA56
MLRYSKLLQILKSLGKILLKVFVAGISSLLVVLALMWVDHSRETMLPMPTGPFAVGRTTYIWSDTKQQEIMAPKPNTRREVFAWIWYPAVPQKLSRPVEYLPAPWRLALENQIGVLLTKFITRDLSKVKAHSIYNGEVSPQQHSYPVILMRAGLAALTTDYTALAEDIASHGYVVVGFDAPYRTTVVVLSNGKVITRAPQNNADLVGGNEQEDLAKHLVQAWASDMSFALDHLERLNSSDTSGRFSGRLDLKRVGVFGHSLGGATALQFCHDDSRCKAGIDVDGAPLGNVVNEGIKQPFMFLMSDHSNEPGTETCPVLANIRSIYNKLPADKRLHILIKGSNHFMFSDRGAMLMSPLMMRMLRILGIVHIDGRRQITLTSHYISTFFDVYLKGKPASLLNRPTKDQEIEYVHLK